ncbi:MAG: PAS domain-containing protein [Verrucomicrobiota bacterium]
MKSTATVQQENSPVLENSSLRPRVFKEEKKPAKIKTPAAATQQTSGGESSPMTALYHTLIESMVDGVVTISPAGVILYANVAFAEMMEASQENITGKSFFEFIRIGWNEPFFKFLHAPSEKLKTVEISLTSRSGKEVPVLLAGNSIQSEHDQGISLTISDQTARKVTEETLRQTEQRLLTVTGLTSDAVWELDGSTKEIWRSEGFAALLGYPPDAIKSTFAWWKQSIHPEDRSPVVAALERLIAAKKGSFNKSYRLRKFNGNYAEVVDRAVAIRDEQTNTFRVIGSIVDVTAKNKAETTKKEISKKIWDAQEQERRRVARELHDGVSQLLASSTFRLHTVQEQVAKSDRSLAKKIEEARDLVEKAQSEVQLISRNLRPSELDDLGLNAALRSFCGGFKKRTGIEIALDTEILPKTLGQDVELTVYRIIQEALNNVEKHARAKKVRLSLSRISTQIVVKISDDGRGFDPKKVRKKWGSGCGLDNMRERASFLNGSVTWISTRSKGTVVTLILPTS